MNKFLPFSVMLLFSFNLLAQESVSTSGGDALGSGGSFSYSVGQTTYTEISSFDSGDLSQGIQKAYEIYEDITLDIIDNNNIELTIKAYPNPTIATLFLFIKDPFIKKYKYQLFDMNGKLIKYAIVKDQESIIDMNRLDIAIYTLVITSQNKIVRKFKIAKK